MANLGQFEDNNKFKDVDAFINSPLPKLGEVNLSPKATSGYSEASRPRLATNKVDYSAYADKPWYEDVAAVGKSIGAGAAVDLPEMVGRAAQAFSTEDSAVSKWGKSVVQSAKDRAKEWEVDMRGRGDVAKAFIEGGRMLAPSLAALPAYLAGPAVGTTATLALYGGSQYQDVYDRAKANGLSDDQAHRAGLLSGAIEGGGEAIANKFSLGMLGVGKKVFGKGMEGAVKGVTGGAEESIAKPFLKEYGKAMVGENITEGLQQYGEGKVEEGFGFGKETTLAGSFGETLGPTSAMTTLLAPLGIAGHYRNAKDAKNANSRAEAINLILDNPSSATPEERMRVVDMIHDHAISLKIPEEEANAWKADALESIKTNAPINRYAESLGSKKDAIVSEKDSLPTGDKLTNKDISKVYSKFSDVFDKAQDPSNPAYQESYNNIISSLDSIITPKEGKDQDKIKVEEATRTKEYIQAVHNRFVKDYNTKNDIDKSQEEIIQSQKESDESKVAETVSEQEELNSLISSSEEKVRNVEETVKTPSKPAKVKVDEVLDTLNRPIDESVGISQEVSDIMDEVVTSEDLVDTPVDEEVEPTVSEAVDEPVEAPTPSPIQPEGQVTAKPPRIDLEAFKESLGIKELPPEQKVSTMEKYSDPVKNLSATLKILENLPEDEKQNYLITIDSIKKQIKDLQESKVEEKPKGVLEIPDASITQTVHYELEKAFSEGNRLPVKLKDGSEIYLVNVKDPKGQSKIAAFDRDGVRIGGLSYSSDPNYAEEVSVNVDKDWRRKGVATLLYDTAEKLGGNIPPFDSKNVFRSHEGQVFRESRELSKQGKPRSSEESNKAFIESKIKEYKSKIEADKYDIQHIKENPNDYLDADLQFAEERLQETLKEYNNFLKESNTLISNKRVHTVKQETKETSPLQFKRLNKVEQFDKLTSDLSITPETIKNKHYTYSDAIIFHSYNPNGIIGQLNKEFNILFDLVNNKKLTTGHLLSNNFDHIRERFGELRKSKRPNAIHYKVALKAGEEALEVIKKDIEKGRQSEISPKVKPEDQGVAKSEEVSNKKTPVVKNEDRVTTKTPNTPKVTKEPVESYKSGDKVLLNKNHIPTKNANKVEPKFLKDNEVIAEYLGPASSKGFSLFNLTYINNGIDADGNPTQKPETKTFKISNRAILKKVGESTSLAEDIKTESSANEEVAVKAVVVSEEPINNLSADDIEESKEEVKISPKTSVTIDSLSSLYEDLLDQKEVAADAYERKEIKEQIDKVVSQLEELGYTISKGGITKINNEVDALESIEAVGGEVYLPEIEVDELDEFGRINFSDETGDYQESTNTSRYDPRTQGEKDRQRAINTNRLVFNKLMEMVAPNATFSTAPGKAVYDTPDVTYILIDDFYEYSQERFEKEEGFSPRSLRSVRDTNGLFYHPVNQKPRIYMNGRTPSKVKFIQTFIHETVGHYGLRKLLEGKGHKYKNFLLHLINSNSEIRKAVLNKYEGWVHYNDNYIKEWVGKGYDYTPTDKEVRAFFDNLVEGKEYVIAKVKYGDSERVVKIPMDVALRYADEYLADLAKELYFDKKFSEEYLGKGVKDSPSRISRRIRMNKMFNMILAKIKHLLRSVFGDYMDHLTIDDVKVMIAASHDNLFHTIDQDALLDVEYKEPHKPRNPILHLKKGGTTTVANEGEEIAHSVGPGTIESEGLAEEPVEVTKKKIEGLVGRPDEFKALQSSGFGNLKGRFLDKQYKALSDKMGSGIFRGLTTFKTMNNVEMYRALNTWFLGNVAKAEKYMKEMEVVFKDVEPIQLKAAYSYFTTKGAELDPKVFPKESVRTKLEEYKTKIEELGKELVDAGLLDPEIYEENKGMYLHTVYLDFIRDYKGSGKKASIMSWYRKRKKLSEKEKLARGQIKDVKYLVPETIGVIMRDTALIQMFNTINSSSIEAKTYWVLTSDTKIKLPWDNRKTITIDRAYELMSDLEDIIDGAEGSTEISAQLGIEKNNIDKLKLDLQTISDRVKVVEDKLLEDAYNQHVLDKTSTDKESFIKNNYIRAPKDLRWGDLSGKLIRKEIYDDLEMVTSSYRLDQMSSEVEKFFAPGGLLERITRFWKKTMVMYNPGSWGRNAVGNFSLLDLSTPTSSVKLMDMIWNEIDTYRKSENGEGSKFWQLATQHGLFGTSYSAVELLDYYNKYADKFQEALDRHSKTPKSSWSQYFPFLDERFMGIINLGKDLALDKYHRFDNTLSKHYSLLEGIFKTVAFRDYIQRYEAQEGISYESLSKDEQEMLFLKATNHANEAIFNYSEVPGIVKFLRRTPMGSPFLTFTYKAAPLMVKSMMTNPVKFAKYATLPAAVTMIAQAVNDWDDDDIKKFRSRLPEYYRNNPGVAFFPFKDSEGRPQILPMDYMIPWNQVWTAASKSYANYMKTGGEGVVGPTVSSAGTFIDEFGFLGGPFPKMITAYKTGKDDFTGRDIVTAGASPNQQLLEQMAYASNMFLPAWLANGGYFSKLYDTLYKEKKNEFGELAMTPLQAVSDITGFRTRSVLEQGGLNARQKEFQSRLREVSTLRNKIIKDRNIDPMDKISKMKDIALREKMIREQMRKAIAGTE